MEQESTDRNAAITELEWLAKLMDSQFRIPGTNIRVGLDALIGLVPGIGDYATVLVSGYMVVVMAQNGASGYLLARMAFNIFIDALIGSIPLAGDLFDVAFKANQRNMRLMREHFTQGRHGGSAWKLILPLLFFLLLLIAAIAWLSYKLVGWMVGVVQGIM